MRISLGKTIFSISLSLLLCAASIGYGRPGFAQSNEERAQSNSDTIIQQQEQRRLQDEINRDLHRDRKALISPIPRLQVPAPKKGVCVDVKEIRLSGYTLFQKADFKPILSRYVGRCLSLSDMNALMDEITNLYIAKGYITSKTYIPAQDLSKGTLSLIIIEGPLEKIDYKAGTHREIETSFPIEEGDILNLRDLEQGLDQLNRLQSNKATMRLLPGKTRGGSVLAIDNTKSAPWHGTATFDNLGTPATGERQGSVSFGYDNLLHASDTLNMSVKRDMNGDTRKNSRSASFYYEIPYGYWNFSYSYNYFDYVSHIATGALSFKNDGTSQTHELGVKRVLHRNEKGITRLHLGLLTKQNNNYLEDVKLETSSRRLTIISAGVSQSYNVSQGFVYGGLTFGQGVTWLGAERNVDTSSSPKAQFQRVTTDIRVVKNVDLGGTPYNPLWETSVRAQWTPDLLYGSEHISVGGPFSVRGFKKLSPSGNIGFYAQNMLSIPVADTPLTPVLGKLRPYVGYDIGKIQQQHKAGIPGGALSSISLGLRNEMGPFDMDMTISRPITVPSDHVAKSAEFYFTLSKSF